MSNFTYIGGVDVSVGPGSFPLTFPSLGPITGIQVNDLIVVVYFINGPLPLSGGKQLSVASITDTLGNTYGTGISAGGDCYSSSLQIVQQFIAGGCEASLFFLGSQFSGSDTLSVGGITQSTLAGLWGSTYTSAYCSVAVYRNIDSSVWSSTTYNTGTANLTSSGSDLTPPLNTTAPQVGSSGDSPPHGPPIIDTVPPFLSLGFISPGSGAPSGAWVGRGTALVVDGENLTTLTVPGTNGILAITTFTPYPALPPIITASCNTPPPAYAGVFYTHDLMATGGTPPYTWSLISGSLPPGLILNPDGTISGTPSALRSSTAKTFTFTVQVTDSNGLTATVTCSITVFNYLAGFPCS